MSPASHRPGPRSQRVADAARHEAPRFRAAIACAVAAAAAAVALLGLSGWFIVMAAGAGVAGMAAAQAFNYLLPSAGIRLVAIVRTAARYGERVLGHEAALRTLARVRPGLYARIAALPAQRALAVTAGDAATLVVQDAQQVEAALVRRPAPWAAGAAFGLGVLLCALATPLAAVVTLLCGALAWAACRTLRPWLARTANAKQQAAIALKESLAVFAASRAELRCHGLGEAALALVDAPTEAQAQADVRQARALASVEAVIAGAAGLAASLALLAACEADAGAALAALAALAASMAVEGLGAVLRDRAQAPAVDAAIERLAAFDDTALDAIDDTAGRDARQALGPSDRPPTPFPSAASTPSAAATLTLRTPFDATLHRGQRIALVGPSGCGKSTWLESLLGLRPLARGTASMRRGGDDRTHDLADLAPADRRACFAWLPQDAALIAGTVRDNLRLAAPDAPDDALWLALHAAALDDVIRARPHGLDTWLGEHAGLSGGERRRLALARALLADRPVLLLDEPTEALDADTERRVLDRLGARLARTGQIALVVTHRAATRAWCGDAAAWRAP